MWLVWELEIVIVSDGRSDKFMTRVEYCQNSLATLARNCQNSLATLARNFYDDRDLLVRQAADRLLASSLKVELVLHKERKPNLPHWSSMLRARLRVYPHKFANFLCWWSMWCVRSIFGNYISMILISTVLQFYTNFGRFSAATDWSPNIPEIAVLMSMVLYFACVSNSDSYLRQCWTK